jgi:sugar lactone lactonase YvrE
MKMPSLKTLRLRSPLHAKRTAAMLTLLMVSTAACAQRVKAKPHDAPASQARLRFVPEVLTTIAGGGIGYSDGSPANSVNLSSSLFGLAFDSAGNTYFATRYPAVVYKVSATDGTITAVLGNPPSGGLGGPGTGERIGGRPGVHVKTAVTPANQITLYGPKGIAVNAADEIFIADTDNNVVYKLDAQYNVTVVAGTPGQSGYSADGTPATGALLSLPTSLTFDANGNLYISDAGNNVIQKVSATDGTLATVAGSTMQGYGGDGALATSAQLNGPTAIAFDPTGNLLFSDANNYVIRKVDKQTGIISTVAGNNTAGYAGDGGPATSAQLSNPFGLAIDAAGQMFIGDTSSNVVRRVALDGTITTVAGRHDEPYNGYDGDGNPATQTNIPEPGSLAFDANGSLYIDVIDAGRVVRLGPGGQLNFGLHEKGTSTTHTLTVENEGTAAATFPYAAFTVQGSGFSAAPGSVNDCLSNAALQPGASCNIAVTFAPTDAADYHATLALSDDAPDAPQVADLYGVGVLPATDTSIAISPQTAAAGDTVQLSATVVPHSGSGPVPTGTVQFLDNNTGTLLATAILNASGVATIQTGSIPIGYYYVYAQYLGDAAYAPSASTGMDLEIEPKSATVQLTASTAIANAGDPITLSAQVVGLSSGIPTGNIQFQIDGTTVATVALQASAAAATVAVPTPGQHSLQAVYIGDVQFGQAVSNLLSLASHGALLQFVPGAAVTVAGLPSDANHGGFSGDGGAAISARMHTPSGVLADGAGNIYIADEQNNVIRKVTPDGTIATVAGTPYVGSIYNTRYGGDGGLAIYAYLDNPTAMALDAANNLYIADYSNNLVRKVDAITGIISTFAGVPYHGGHNTDSGVATDTWLNNPAALAFDTAGNLYIADTGNNLVRKVDPSGAMTTVAGHYGYYSTTADGQPATSQVLNRPEGVAVDTAGNLYIADTSANVVRKVDTSGNMFRFAGGSSSYVVNYGDGGPAISATLNLPQQMAFDLAGDLFIAGPGESSVRKVDPIGIITTVAGTHDPQPSGSHYDPAGTAATLVPLIAPSGVAIDPYGSLLVTDDYNQTVWRVGPQGTVVFGAQAAGTTSTPQTVALYNAGDRPATFASTPYAITGDYIVTPGTTNSCDFTAALAPGVSCTIGISYKPATGTTNGTVIFVGSAIGTPTINLRTNLNPPPSTTQLLLSSTMPNLGDNLLIYGQVASTVYGPTPTGTVSFFDASTLLGQAAISGGFGYTYYPGLAIGDHSLTAVYGGDGYNAPSTSDPTTVSVQGTATQTALSVGSTAVSIGAAVRLTATVTSTNTPLTVGTVTFFDGTTQLGTANVNGSGIATFTTPGLTSGSHSFTAVYGATGTYSGSTSAAVTVTTSGGGSGSDPFQPLYTVDAVGLPVTLRPGDTATIQLHFTLLNNVSAIIPLSCGTLPSYATCTFSSPNVILAGPITSQTITWTITTTGAGANVPMRLGGIAKSILAAGQKQ